MPDRLLSGAARCPRALALLCVFIPAAMLLSCAHAAGAPEGSEPNPAGATYHSHDVAPAVVPASEGKPSSLDLAYVDQVTHDLQRALGHYPPVFATPGDRKEAVTDVAQFGAMLDAAGQVPPAQVEVIWRAAVIYALAHRLDQAGTPERAHALFTKALQLAPEHAAANYFFGLFLSGAGRSKQALPHLQKAQAAGVAPADRALGMAYLTTGDVPRAVDCLRRHLKKHPGDQQVAALLQGLEKGKVKVKVEQVQVQ